MAAGIKPFEKLAKAPLGASGNAFVKIRYLFKVFKAILGGFEILTDGSLELTQPTPTSLMLKVSSANDSTQVDPFTVTLGDKSISVAPGRVYSSQAIQGPWCTPVINGVPLDAATAPALPFSSAGQGFVCVQAEFNTDGSAANWPWPIIFSQSIPQDTPLIRDNSVGTPQPGTYNIIIASISNGAVNQWVRRNLCINLQWEQLYIEG